MKSIFITVLITALLFSGVISAYGITNDEAKKKITDAIDNAVEGNWTSIDDLSISQYNNPNNETVVNNTVPVEPPNPCPPDTHLENGICVPNNPPPTPNKTKIEVVLVGDVDGNKVKSAVANEKADFAFYLGDLEYGTASDFRPYLTTAKIVQCVIGNHDDDPEFETICGDTWSLKTGKVLWLGVNTEKAGDQKQKDFIKKAIDNNKGVVAVHLLSHKPTESVPPNSHHGLEDGVVKLGDYIESLIPQGVLLYRENGHNHLYSESGDGLLKQIGSGGRDFYECGQDAVWTYCNNKDFGYYKYTVDVNTGETTGNFYGTNGQVIH